MALGMPVVVVWRLDGGRMTAAGISRRKNSAVLVMGTVMDLTPPLPVIIGGMLCHVLKFVVAMG